MRWLHEYKFQVLSLTEIVEYIKHGRSLPPRSIAITFDDGFECIYKNAYPILLKYGFPATIFLVTGYCGKANNWPGQPAFIPRLTISNWPQIREMEHGGVEFGSHTVNHPRLDKFPPNQIEEEIVKSKCMIENELDHPVNLFAYPYGRFNETIKKCVRLTYRGALTAKPGLVKADSDPYELARVDTYYVRRPFLFKELASPFLFVYLSFRWRMRSINSFVSRRAWG